MGDLTWLQTLTQGGATAAVIGLVVWLLRWIVRREREISAEHRDSATVALSASKQMLANQERIIATQERHNEILWHILNELGPSDGTGRHRGSVYGNGSPEGPASAATSDWRSDSRPRG